MAGRKAGATWTGRMENKLYDCVLTEEGAKERTRAYRVANESLTFDSASPPWHIHTPSPCKREQVSVSLF